MTAVANLPSLQQNNRPRWNVSGGQVSFDALNTDGVPRKFVPRKSAPRSNSTSSIASSSSSSSSSTPATLQSKFQLNGASMSASADAGMWTATSATKKTPKPDPWPSGKGNTTSMLRTRPIRRTSRTATSESIAQPGDMTHTNQQSAIISSQYSSQTSSQSSNASHPPAQTSSEITPILCLVSMNGTFDRKTISVPYYPASIRIGRQTNSKTTPTQLNGFFDSKVLSRQHAELWADKSGKVWIRDVKSSNGTFVNGTRLSSENRESEPHELEAQDHLDLGIDIISEDLTRIAHQKVAARVEYAGYPSAAYNYADSSLGDLKNSPGATTGSTQDPTQIRGRMDTNNISANSNRLTNPNVAGSQLNNQLGQISAGQQRQMNFWLTPVTMEQIVKKLSHEMRIARLQTNELKRTSEFLGTLLFNDNLRETDKPIAGAVITPYLANNGFSSETKSCFSNPPAPPPQQPLPEKPDFARSNDSQSQISHVTRSKNERSPSISSNALVRPETSNHLVSLMEALGSARKEIDLQSVKLRDMEQMLQREKKAREFAEDVANQLKSKSDVNPNVYLTAGSGGSVVETFEPSIECVNNMENSESRQEIVDENQSQTTDKSSNSSEEYLQTVLDQMRELKEQMEMYKLRAETAESQRDSDRKSLVKLTERVRSNEIICETPSPDSFPSQSHRLDLQNFNNTKINTLDTNSIISDIQSPKTNSDSVCHISKNEFSVENIKNTSSVSSNPLFYHHAAPFASMLGIVLIGVGIMSYINGWQIIKIEP